MFNVRNKDDLILAYLLVRDRKVCAANPEAIADIKRSMRKYQRNHKATVNPIVAGGFDWFLELIKTPCGSFDEACEWFMKNGYMPCVPSQYDCTGQLFTSYYKVFERHGEYLVYHRVNVDV